MQLLAKKIIAGALVLGVGGVWLPRMNGNGPFQFFSTKGSAGLSPLPVSSADFSVDSFDESADMAEGASPDRSAAMVTELETALGFLESRGGQHGAAGWRGPSASELQSTITWQDPSASPEHAERGGVMPSESFTIDRAVVTDLLDRHPLHTIIAGDGRVTATFGFHRVTVGDALFDAAIVVTEISEHGVTLDTPDGPVRVHLPPLGESVIPSPVPTRTFQVPSSALSLDVERHEAAAVEIDEAD